MEDEVEDEEISQHGSNLNTSFSSWFPLSHFVSFYLFSLLIYIVLFPWSFPAHI